MVASFQIEVPDEPPYEVRLEPKVITVGRAESNVLGLRDMNVSRHHFTVERRGEFYVLQDRGSRNGSLVNGVAILTKVLEEGDAIVVGGTTLTFRRNASPQALRTHLAPRPSQATAARPSGAALRPAPEAEPKPFSALATPGGPLLPPGMLPAGVDFGRIPAPSAPTRPLSRSSEFLDKQVPPPPSRNPAKPQRSDPPTRHSERLRRVKAQDRWQKLAEVACAINLEHDTDQLLETILDKVLELVPSKGAFLVLLEGEHLIVRANRDAGVKVGGDLEGQDARRLSRQVCREAIAQKRPVLTQDAESDEKLNQYLSVVNLRLKSILCVPFASQDEVLGVVYLDEPKINLFKGQGEVVELVGAFGELAGIALANARLMEEVAARERLEQEVAIASRIQRSLLPKRPPTVEGLELAGHMIAARGVGGDVYDFLPRGEPYNDVLISIGDVAGKGVGAGMVMATVRALLHAYAEVYAPTDELLVALNRTLSHDLDPGIFVSYLLLRYSPETGKLLYTGAGHEHLILYRPSTDQMEFVRAGGVVLGLVDDLETRVEEQPLNLQSGDVVCLYTDGATEAPAAEDESEEFGLERIGAAIKAGPLDPSAIVERVLAAVREFSFPAPSAQASGEHARVPEMHDDLTVVAFRKS